MRTARLKKRGTAVYHCISRSVAGAFLLDGEAKTVFRKMLWEVAEFCGVEVLAYCVMTNHFHILVRVPERDSAVLTKEEVLRRYTVLYARSNTPGYPDAASLRTIFEGPDEALAADWMERLTARMQDVSEFLKTVKQRFTMWYNKRHRRFGTLWSERFKSVLVQNDPNVLRTVAAYVDLNPVRAGVVEDPTDYAWCSYGEAQGGAVWAQRGLMRMLRCGNWPETAHAYRKTLGPWRCRESGVGSGDAVGGGGGVMSEGEGSGGGPVAETDPVAQLLRTRQPHFTEGRVLGEEGFVEAMAPDVASTSPRPKPKGLLSLGTAGVLFCGRTFGKSKSGLETATVPPAH